MSYDISLKVKVDGIDKFVSVADGGNITWNVRELIEKSSGWDIKNEDNNGTAEQIGLLIEKGMHELETNPKAYRQYEAPNGWGTVEGTLRFFKHLYEVCQEYPYAYVFVH